MNQPDVTIIVSPRERFSYSRESLESIYKNTNYPFSLVYVDGNSPHNVQKYLQNKSQAQDFKLIRSEKYLAPNQARNIGLNFVDSKYLVFIDNDVYVEPGWLEKLVHCAEETDAAVVCPLVCIGQERLSKIHLAGGEARIIVEIRHETVCRKVHEKHYFVNRSVDEVQSQLQRQKCEFAEFHCMLVRTDIFQSLGQLDEKLLSTREHIDFCLMVTNAGGSIYCEPDSVVTYITAEKFALSDIPYFLLRWSDAWELASLKRFRKKWDVTKKDKYFRKRYKRLGHRRHKALLRPLVRKLSFGGYATWLEKILIAGERQLNQYISDRYSIEH
ncbi:putative glycosyltransferase [Xenococcus sp. PCC 7305]|uniref:glycosyltransferase family 2 protein n=1 Tax=Xenococcus sp. PCC 7305 TaxID=102125 RepID=UPI0002AC8CBC|nr:glycosyltransferase [Xenococcus sp. PCC 7305]ELS03714.1 putative glycosyltransferase [Xenococcus sp. PCC 7305]